MVDGSRGEDSVCWLVEENRVTKGTRRRRRRTEGSSFSLLFPLIKISNMITADLATIIEQLEVEFAKPRFASASAVAATKPSVVLYLPFLFFPSPSIPLLAVSFSPFLSSLSFSLSLASPFASRSSSFTRDADKPAKDPVCRRDDKLARRIRRTRATNLVRIVNPYDTRGDLVAPFRSRISRRESWSAPVSLIPV